MLVSAAAADGEPEFWDTEEVTVAPGGRGLAQVSVTPTGFGHWSHVFTLGTNDPRQHKVRMVVEATVKPRLEIEPRLVDLGSLPAGRDSCVVLHVSPLRDELLELEGVDLGTGSTGATEPGRAIGTGPARASRLRASYVRDAANSHRWTVTLCLRPDAPVGPILETVRIRTNDPLVPAAEVLVRGTLTGGLSYPKHVELESPFAGLSAETTVPVRRLSGPPFRITGVSVNNPHVRAAVETVEEGEAYNVVLTLLPDTPEGLRSAQLQVRTDRADAAEFPVVIQVRMGRGGRPGHGR